VTPTRTATSLDPERGRRRQRRYRVRAHARERAVDIGTRAADADLKAYALTNLGSLKIATGETIDGFALMEEAVDLGRQRGVVADDLRDHGLPDDRRVPRT